MKKILFILLVLLSQKLHANHLVSMELKYEYNGTNYTFYLTYKGLCQLYNVHKSYEFLYVSSASTGIQFVKIISDTLEKIDTTDIHCGLLKNSCYDLTSTVPGYSIITSVDTMNLPPANDWIISYNTSAGITSINTASLTNFEVHTELDNSLGYNSNPVISDMPLLCTTPGSILSVPLQYTDPDGDSVSIELIRTRKLDTTYLDYNTGYSLMNPLGTGGICEIDTASKTLKLMALNTGNYILSYRVSEYRKKNFIGSYEKTFTLHVINGLAITPPVLNPVNVLKTCAGETRNLILNFTDPGINDSVMLNIVSPSLPGWAFSTNVVNGIATAVANISWTAPVTLDTNTTPFIKFLVNAKDNACPSSSVDYFVVAKTGKCPVQIDDVEAKHAAMVLPNPSIGEARLHITSSHSSRQIVTVTDILGHPVWNMIFNANAGMNEMFLPMNIPAGLYFIEINNEERKNEQVLKWTKL